MTGPEHYRRAEWLLEESDGKPVTIAGQFFAEAQVHAILALTAATAQDRLGIDDRAAWSKAMS